MHFPQNGASIRRLDALLAKTLVVLLALSLALMTQMMDQIINSAVFVVVPSEPNDSK